MGLLDKLQDIVSTGDEERFSSEAAAEDIDDLFDENHIHFEELDHSRATLTETLTELASRHSETVAPAAWQLYEAKARAIRQRGESGVENDERQRKKREWMDRYGNDSELIDLAERIDSILRELIKHTDFSANSEWNGLKTWKELEERYPTLMRMWGDAILVRTELNDSPEDRSWSDPFAE